MGDLFKIIKVKQRSFWEALGYILGFIFGITMFCVGVITTFNWCLKGMAP